MRPHNPRYVQVPAAACDALRTRQGACVAAVVDRRPGGASLNISGESKNTQDSHWHARVKQRLANCLNGLGHRASVVKHRSLDHPGG
jgi:hypothetical protein